MQSGDEKEVAVGDLGFGVELFHEELGQEVPKLILGSLDEVVAEREVLLATDLHYALRTFRQILQTRIIKHVSMQMKIFPTAWNVMKGAVVVEVDVVVVNFNEK